MACDHAVSTGEQCSGFWDPIKSHEQSGLSAADIQLQAKIGAPQRTTADIGGIVLIKHVRHRSIPCSNGLAGTLIHSYCCYPTVDLHEFHPRKIVYQQTLEWIPKLRESYTSHTTPMYKLAKSQHSVSYQSHDVLQFATASPAPATKLWLILVALSGYQPCGRRLLYWSTRKWNRWR